VVAGAHRNDSPLLGPTVDKLARFNEGMGVGLPEDITVHLDAGYDSAKTHDLLTELDCSGVISVKGFPLQAGKRWVVERTNSWHNRSFKKLATCTERRNPRHRCLQRAGQRRDHHSPATRRGLAHPPLGQTTHPPPMTYLRNLCGCWAARSSRRPPVRLGWGKYGSAVRAFSGAAS
jgi:hypothetical protein